MKNFIKILLLSLLILPQIANAQSTEEIDDTYVQKILSSSNIKSLKRLINAGLDVNSRDDNGNTMLYYTLTHNPNLEMAKALIDAGADVNAPSYDGMTPLIIATSIAKIVQDQQKSLQRPQNAPDDFVSEEVATRVNQAVEMTKLLVNNGADVNQITPLGSPLMNASTSDLNTEIIEILIKAGAKLDLRDRNGKTAIFYAQEFGCDEVISLLIKSGADLNITDDKGLTYMERENDLSLD